MTTPTLVVLSIAVVAVFVLPRRWVPVPFLVLACYVPRSQILDLGPFSFTVLRTLTVVAIVRLLLRNNWKGVIPGLPDYLMLGWSALMVGTVALHADPANQVIERLGLVLDAFGLYLVFRLFCRSEEDVRFICVALGLLLVPLALSMVYEKISAQNLLSFLGGRDIPHIRDGRVRAQGPFRHSILAGTIGAVSIPFVLALWPTRRAIAVLGFVACLCIVVSSTSSGPLMSLAAAFVALALWPLRAHIRLITWAGLGLYCLLSVVMNRPVYYLISMIDLTGSSTGWHRARLIESAINHLDEWWLAGTDYTRHWMATGVSFSPDHTDVTNHYIALGVYGGLPLLLCFLALVVACFYQVGQRLEAGSKEDTESLLLPWAIGATLFTIAVTSVSIAFFDQSILWMYMTFAFCGSLAHKPIVAVPRLRESPDVVAAQHRVRRRSHRRTLIRLGS